MDHLRIFEKEVIERQATHLVGTLGHVSEGKSTLVRALTGVKTQRHQKEQIRNITIHLGYANCKIYQNIETGELIAKKTSESQPEGYELMAHLSFVDCPGHEAFLATMLGGASIMDTACLVIASNQDVIPQPQTLEHLIAADLMGLERICILQNKLDLITKDNAQENLKKIKGFLKDTIAEESPIYPISAQHGWNVQEVLEYILTLPSLERELNEAASLTCVRSFDVNKPQEWIADTTELKGGIIGGTLTRGVLVKGDWIEMRPGFVDGNGIAHPVLTQIVGLRCEETELPYAIPGSLIALETTLDPSLTAANRCVGQRIGPVGSLPPIVKEIEVKFRSLKRQTNTFGKVRVGDVVRVCANVMTVEGVVTELPEKRIRRIQLKKPLCLESGDIISVMRFNKEANRELLEGCGFVSSVKEWDKIAPLESADYVIPNRKVEWIPMEKSEFETTTYSYENFLEELYEKKSAELGTKEPPKLRLREPVLEKIPKQTVWTNWSQTVDSLGDPSYSDHFKEWLCKELATEANVNGNRQLIIRGIWKLQGICSLLRKYVQMYKKCKQCQQVDTKLLTQGKVVKVWCERCKTDTFVE